MATGLGIAAYLAQLEGNGLARQANSLAQTGNKLTAEGNAAANLSNEFQLYDECHDRPVGIILFSISILRESNEEYRSFEIIRIVFMLITAS